jgi:hypothetical protein
MALWGNGFIARIPQQEIKRLKCEIAVELLAPK